MNSTEAVDRPRRVYPGGAMILHYKTADNVVPAPAGLVPVDLEHSLRLGFLVKDFLICAVYNNNETIDA